MAKNKNKTEQNKEQKKGFFSKLSDLYKKHKEICNYILVGGITTLVRWGTAAMIEPWFEPMSMGDGVKSLLITLLSLIITILFAYPPNKLFVFESKSFRREIVSKEFVAFISARAVASIIELVGIPTLVTLTGMSNMLATMAGSIIVLVANYIFSKLVIFKKRTVTDKNGKDTVSTDSKVRAKDKLIALVLTIICAAVAVISIIFCVIEFWGYVVLGWEWFLGLFG